MLALLLALAGPDPIATIDSLAQRRNIEGLGRLAAGVLAKEGRNPFQFVRVGGAYGSGSDGWRVRGLADADGKTRWAVFTTKTTNEDIGEQVFELRGGKLVRHLPEADGLGYRIRHHDFAISFRIAERRAIVSDSLQISRTGPWRPSFQFRIGPHFRISRLRDETGKSVRFAQAGGVVSVASPKAPRFRLALDYQGIVDTPHFAGAVNEREAMLTGDFWYPMIARGAATYTARVEAPRAWTTIAQGVKKGEKVAGESNVTTWSMPLPTCVFSLTSGPYRRASIVRNGRTYSAYSTTLGDADLLLQCELNQAIVEFYSTIAPYPFPEWAAIDSPNYGSGWLEAYSFATYEAGSIPVDDAHEPAHTWWGGIVPNTYLRSLWNESFASYCDGLFEREGGPGNQQERREAFVQDVGVSPAFAEIPVALGGCESGPAATALAYGKGALVLQMLEVEIGTEAMIASMRAWCRGHRRGEVGEWEDFERVASRTAGRDLKPFFDDWLRKPGWIDLGVTKVAWADGAVTADIAFGRFGLRFQPEVMLQYADGRRVFSRFEVLAGRAKVASPEKPVLISVDPWRRVLRPVEEDEHPVSLRGLLLGRTWVAPGREAEADRLLGSRWRRRRLDSIPADLAGVVLVGRPSDHAAIAQLAGQAGLEVSGDAVRWKGTSVPLAQGAGMAAVDVPWGQAVIAMGSPALPPRVGRARTALFDRLGRLVRGLTEPKTEGTLTFRL